MLRFGVLLIYLTEIKLCINLVLHFVSNATFTHALEAAVSTLLYCHTYFPDRLDYLSEQIPLCSRQHDFPLCIIVPVPFLG